METNYTELMVQKPADFVVRSSCKLLQLQHARVCDIVWITAGAAELVGATKISVKHNRMYCFGPGQLKMIVRSNDIKGFHLTVPSGCLHITGHSFNLSFLNCQHTTTKDPIGIDVSQRNQRFLATIVLKMQEEQKQSQVLRTEMIKGLLNILLLCLSAECSVKRVPAGCSSDSKLVEQFFRFLKDDHKSMKKVQAYAQALHITPNYLNQVIKKVTGRTASHHIQQKIIEEAKKQAMDSGSSMKEVAYGLGFDSMAHFSKFFKVNCGVNFTMFRRQSFCIVQE